VTNGITPGGCADSSWARLTALPGAAVTRVLRVVMHASVAARSEIAIACRLVHFGRRSVAVGQGLVGVGCGLVLVRAGLVLVR
jgi:hypothetical protein